jgi:hypothetical protein
VYENVFENLGYSLYFNNSWTKMGFVPNPRGIEVFHWPFRIICLMKILRMAYRPKYIY